jgi:hypothetical protein
MMAGYEKALFSHRHRKFTCKNAAKHHTAQDELKHINMMTDSALDLTKAGYWLIDYSDPEYYTSSERAAAIFGEHPTPGWRYHLMDEWYNRIAAADPKVAEATGAHYGEAVAGTIPRYDCTYCYKRPIDGKVAWIRAIGNVERDAEGTYSAKMLAEAQGGSISMETSDEKNATRIIVILPAE